MAREKAASFDCCPLQVLNTSPLADEQLTYSSVDSQLLLLLTL